MKQLIKKLLLLTMVACLCITPITPVMDSYQNPYEVMPLDVPSSQRGDRH